MIAHLKKMLRSDLDSTSDSGQYPNQAAVLLALTNVSEDPEIVFTKRSEHLSTHKGEVSFPGGKWDATDTSLLHTALREAEEEIGLNASDIDIIASLPSRVTRFGIEVTPFVGVIPQQVSMRPNPDELDAIFQVPISFFLADQRVRTDLFTIKEREYWTPAYHFGGFEIWGFTAGVLVSFLNTVYQAGINKNNSAPVRVFRC